MTTYISFDEFSKDALHKEREACFTAGTNGEKLAQYITDAKDKHNKNVGALRHTVHLFTDDEPKRRLHGKVTTRLEQERKWVAHFDGCISEHKKGTQVYRLKVELEKTKAEFVKQAAAIRKAHEEKLEETRKQCRVMYRAEFEAELKAKKEEVKEAVKEKEKFWSWRWLYGWLLPKKTKKVAPKPAPMVLKQAAPSNSNVNKKQEFLQMKPEDRKALLKEKLKAAAEKREAA